jgi:hypothetical protein
MCAGHIFGSAARGCRFSMALGKFSYSRTTVLTAYVPTPDVLPQDFDLHHQAAK